jgi:hypothetical protein
MGLHPGNDSSWVFSHAVMDGNGANSLEHDAAAQVAQNLPLLGKLGLAYRSDRIRFRTGIDHGVRLVRAGAGLLTLRQHHPKMPTLLLP